MDESLSTLDYANRAKNIRNKPEINQKMTKKTLIKEYVTEIERLKGDLIATREKNGIFMSSETYSSLMEQTESRKGQIEEISKIIIQKEEHLVALELKYKQNSVLLKESSFKLQDTIQELEQSKIELNASLQSLVQVKNELLEQKIITK